VINKNAEEPALSLQEGTTFSSYLKPDNSKMNTCHRKNDAKTNLPFVHTPATL
jgi:hypothetical protein